MGAYITFFKADGGSEALVVDEFTRVEAIIVWESKKKYFAARQAEPKPIDGGVYTYGLIAGASMAPDSLISDQIVSYKAPDSLLDLLGQLDSVVHALRKADWPNWPDLK